MFKSMLPAIKPRIWAHPWECPKLCSLHRLYHNRDPRTL